MGVNVRKPILGHQRGMRIQCYRVLYTSGVPALVEGTYDAAPPTDNGTGDFTLTFNEPGSRGFVVMGVVVENGATKLYGVVNATTATTLRIVVSTDAGVATDPTSGTGVVHVTVCHFDDPSQQ